MPLWGESWGGDWGGTLENRMETTTLDDLRDAFRDRIRQITPAHPRFNDAWKPVDRVDDVPGGDIRLFCVELFDEEPDPDDSIWGDGFTQRAQLQVWTNYGGLEEREPESILSQDARQIYLNLECRLDPQIAGLQSVESVGWTDETDDNGNVWGAHVFRIRYLAANTL